MRWADSEAIGLFENIKNGIDVTDNYGRLIWNFTNRGQAWRDLEVVGLLTQIRAGTNVVDNYGRLIWNFANRGGQFGVSMYYLLQAVRDSVAGDVSSHILSEDGKILTAEDGTHLIIE